MPSSRTFPRRAFLQLAAVIPLGWTLPLTIHGITTGPPLPRRPLGKTGVSTSLVGLSCGHLHFAPSPEEARALIRFFVDHGVNYYDTSPEYGGGLGEILLGEALAGDRGRIFIASKTRHRRAREAMDELRTTMRRLQTDYVDAWMIQNPSPEEFETCLTRGGIIEAMQYARRAGMCRWIGLSGLSDPSWLHETLDRYPFDVVQMPLNCADPHYLSFEREALPNLDAKSIGIIGCKTFLMGLFTKIRSLTAQEVLQYSLSLPVSCVLAGCSTMEEARLDIALAQRFTPLSSEQKEEIQLRSRPLSNRSVEWYKRMI